MDKYKKTLINMSQYTIFVILFLVIIAGAYGKRDFTVYSANSNKYLTYYELGLTKSEEKIEPKQEVRKVNSLAEVIKYAPAEKVRFSGSMTAYGPDCPGCSGIVGCPPRKDVRNGNIYSNDSKYGKLRIIAGDRKIPCGTIMKVSGAKGMEDFYAIVLDRGGAIKETVFDLLFESQKIAKPFGRQKITYETVRWGW